MKTKFLILLILIIIPFQIRAQDYSSFQEKALISLSPEIPSPGESVVATVKSSYFESLQKAEVIWHINNVERKKGLGLTTFQFLAPEAGETLELFVTVDRGNGSTFANFINIQTASVDLITEADTYIPPFYKGRSLFTPQSNVKIAAIASLFENGVKLSKNQIIYNWYRNGEYITEVSGVGKDSAVFQGNMVSRPFNVSVIAESINSNLKAEKSILISTKNPKVVLYENNPIYGSVFEKSLSGTFNFDREEVGITAVPYFFSADRRDSEYLKYSWFENGREIGENTLGSFINYLNPNKEKNGISNLGVEIESNKNFLQNNSSYFQINVLGNQQSGTIRTNETSVF